MGSRDVQELPPPPLQEQGEAMNHLIVRAHGVLCTKCFVTEPVHQGDGTPMSTLMKAYLMLEKRHRACRPAKAEEK